MATVTTRALALGIIVILSGSVARADPATPVYTPPDGFWLRPSDHSGRLYGPSNTNATWYVGQWDIPKDLPSFVNGLTGNEYASVAIGRGTYSLRQTTQLLPCDKVFNSGRSLPDEFDLFVAPNNINTPGYPQAHRLLGPDLATATAIIHQIGVEVGSAKLLDNVCPTTQATLLTAVVLTNKNSQQTFFYQLRLGITKAVSSGVDQELPPARWFFTGKNIQSGGSRQFGFGDNISSFGFLPVRQVGSLNTFKIDILPRLKVLLAQGEKFGLDQNLAHWQVTGTYHGQNAFGHVEFSSTWTAFDLRVL